MIVPNDVWLLKQNEEVNFFATNFYKTMVFENTKIAERMITGYRLWSYD